MNYTYRAGSLALRAALLASTVAGTAYPVAATAQAANAPGGDGAAAAQADSDDTVVVIGTRIGSGSATEVKRNALQSISTLTAEDLAQIPETAVADILRRIPGVSVNQSGGGGITTIRGLRDIGYLLNGRNLTSTVSRGFDAAALPGDLISGIDVYKTPSASQIEGGIGGVLDFRTRRPLDFSGFAGSVTAKAGYSDIANNLRPYLSGFVSDRVDTSLGEFGALLGGSYQKQATAQYVARVDGNAVRNDGTGKAVSTSNNAIKRQFFGGKTLETIFASLQWRPDPRFEITGDLMYNNEGLDFSNQSLVAQISRGTPSGAFATYDGSDAFRSGSFTGVPLSSDASQGVGYFRTRQAALTGRYKDGPLTVSGDLSWTKTVFLYQAPSVSLGATGAAVALDTGAPVPRYTVTGVDPANPGAWSYASYSNYVARDYSTELAYRGDVIYELGGPLKNIQAGFRHVTRDVGHQQNFISAAAPAGVGAVASGNGFGVTSDRLWNDDYPQRRWFSPLGVYDNNGRYQQLFGLPTGRPPYDPNQAYDAVEKVLAGYGQLTFGFRIGDIPVDGNVGVRVARTKLDVTGVQRLSAGGTGPVFSPIRATQNFTDALPMVNLRAEPAENLFWRLAFSKSLTRPSFSRLSPSVTLDAVNLVGSAGNPNLRPLRADQYDTSLEWYFRPQSMIYVSGFYKDLSGFIRTVASQETLNGRNYLISRPQNIDSSWLGGVEIGYQHRLAFLPGALSGLGVTASFTYIDSQKTKNRGGFEVGLEQLAPRTYLVGLDYRKYGVTGNLAYVRRGRILEASVGDAAARPLYNEGFGTLDLSLTYDVTPAVSVQFNALNLANGRQQQNFLNRQFFNQTFLEGRRIFGGVLVRFGSLVR